MPTYSALYAWLCIFGCLYALLFFISQRLPLSSLWQRRLIIGTRLLFFVVLLRNTNLAHNSSLRHACVATLWISTGFFFTLAVLQYLSQRRA